MALLVALKVKLLYLFMVLPGLLTAQLNLVGRVTNKSTKAALPFVSIGVVGKAVGTLSGENGDFSLSIDSNQLADSLKIACVGYKQQAYLLSAIKTNKDFLIELEPLSLQLQEVVVNSKSFKHKTLGTGNYTKNNCTGFVDVGGNWKGSEAAILVHNKNKVLIESFQFYIIQNKYTDSLLFRLMLYTKTSTGNVGGTFLQKPVIFKVGQKQGEFTLPLRNYNLVTNSDFFISLECLMDEMEITRFCYAGSPKVPSYFKVKAFSGWKNSLGQRSGGGGADFNVKVAILE